MLRFFNEPAVREAIENLARAQRLTVVAGAGSSMEIGLPSWEALVLGLLGDVIARNGWSDDEERLREAARHNGLLATAEMVEAMLAGQEIPAAIKRHLYGDTDPLALRPGPLARAVAALQHEFGDRMRLATTNYDEVLELALRSRPGSRRWWSNVRSAVGPEDSGTGGTVTVIHLHGLLGRRDRGPVILSEGDYQRMQLRASWQEEWMVDALSTTTCLFVGASMTDANLIRYLYRASPSRRPHVALFRRRLAVNADDERFRERAERIEQARWERLGIVPLFADNFADIAQFVHEVACRRHAGAAEYHPLPDRLHEWYRRERATGSLYREEDEGYREVQELLHQGLRELIQDARILLSGFGVDTSHETLGVSLWALYPIDGPRRQEQALVVAASDRVMTSVGTITPVPLASTSDWTGVKTIAAGVPLGEAVDNYATRWRFVLGFPVYRHDPRTPLGALTLSTVTPRPQTVLANLPAGPRWALEDFLVRSVETLLTIGEIEE